MRRCLLAGGLLLVLASAGSSQATSPPDDGLSPAEIIWTLAKPLEPGAGAKPDAAAKPPSAAAKSGPAAAKPEVSKAAAAKRDPDGLQQCLRSWDSATHMTRGDWARVCRSIVVERARRTAAQPAQ